jgi:ribulose-phosphate 3-epimerase
VNPVPTSVHCKAEAKRRSRQEAWSQQLPAILPSLLLCDFGQLDREVERLEEAGAKGLHLDVMDGHFVPNLTYGLPIVEAIRRRTQLQLDVHLMISRPEQLASRFVEAGADLVTFHIEATEHPPELLEQLRRLGVLAGLAINPNTPLDALLPHLPLCDLVLVMSVQAGFGGQAFEPVALDRLTQLRRHGRSDLKLEVDGGVNLDTIHSCAAAGADLLVVGSAIFRHADYSAAIGQLKSRLTGG